MRDSKRSEMGHSQVTQAPAFQRRNGPGEVVLGNEPSGEIG